MSDHTLTEILKKRLTKVGEDETSYAHKSFRYGMACTVLLNQCEMAGGVVYCDRLLDYLEIVGRWTNSK